MNGMVMMPAYVAFGDFQANMLHCPDMLSSTELFLCEGAMSSQVSHRYRYEEGANFHLMRGVMNDDLIARLDAFGSSV